MTATTVNFNNLKDLKTLNFSNANTQFQQIMLTDYLRKVLDDEKYHLKASVGMGTFAANWWVSICDCKFYAKMYGITDKRKISAQIGYYIAYLFNEDNSKVYLSLNQASTNINRPINEELKSFRRKINKYLLDNIKYPTSMLTDIHGKLTTSVKNTKAKDYEEGTLLAIEYDLNNNTYSLDTMTKDLKSMIKVYNSIIKILLKKSVLINNEKYDFVNRIIIKDSDQNKVKSLSTLLPEEESVDMKEVFNTLASYPGLDKAEVTKINARAPEFKTRGRQYRLKTNAKLIKYVLENSDFTCQICGKKHTFETPNGAMYMEGHHFVPVSYQKTFAFGDYNLDNTDNIVCLCPECHRALHYGSYEEIINRLIPLYEQTKMKDVLKRLNIATNLQEFIDMYSHGL